MALIERPPRLRRLALLLILFSALGATFVPADEAGKLAARLEPDVRRIMEEGKIPAISIALVADGKTVWTGAFGFSNLWAKTPAAPETVFLVGSIFKTMSTVVLLQQMERGAFKLEDPVGSYLTEFKIQGDDPSHPVTFLHLLTHTSGLPADYGPHPVWGDTVPPPLSEYLGRSLVLKTPPGTQVLYSNTAFTLLAYLVEKFSGVPFKDFIGRNIFDLLGMKDTAFIPRPDMEERLAVPYTYDARTGRHVPTVRTKADVWPAGLVYGTVGDLSRWLEVMLSEGKHGSGRLLREETFRRMMTRQFDRFAGPLSAGWLNETTGYGLTWWISQRDGETLFAHSGSISGYTAFLVGNLDRKTGCVFMSNGHQAHKHLFELALKALDGIEDWKKEGRGL